MKKGQENTTKNGRAPERVPASSYRMTLRLGYALAERVVFDLVIVGKGFVEGFKLRL